MAKEKVGTYPEAARVINLWLNEFCGETMPYPAMIAEAARRAAKEIERLRHLTSAIHADGDKLCDCEEPNLHPSHPGFCSDCNRRR